MSFDLEAFVAEAHAASAQPASGSPPAPAREPRPSRCPRGPAYDLMPDSIRKKLPTEEGALRQGLDAMVEVKYTMPGTGLTWYVVGYDPEDDIVFNWHIGSMGNSMGTVFLHELESVCAGGLFYVKRDLHFTPATLREIREARP